MSKHKAQILITLDEAGMLEVTGSTENKLLFLGMLELAKDTVMAQRHAEASVIQSVIPTMQLQRR